MIVVALLAILSLAVVLLAPPLFERAITDYMERAGIDSPEIRVESVTPRGIYATGLTVQQGRLCVDSLSIYYSFTGLLRGHIDRAAVSGLTWRITVRDGVVDTGLPEIENATASSSATPPPLPLETLQVSSSSIIVDYEGINITIPFSFRLDVAEGRRLTLAGRVDPLGLPVSIVAEGDATARTGSAQARLLRVSRESGESPLACTFDLSASWRRGEHDEGWGLLDLSGEIKTVVVDVAGIEAHLEEGSLFARTRLEDASGTLEGGLRLSGLQYGDYVLDHANLTIDDGGGASTLSARIVEPLRAVVSIAGNHPSLPEMIKNTAPAEGLFQWAVQGEVPQKMISRLSAGRGSADDPLPFKGSGTLSAYFKSKGDWSLDAKTAEVIAGPLTVSTPGDAMRLEDALFRGTGTIFADPAGLKFDLDGNSLVSVSRITRNDARLPVVIEEIELAARRGMPLLSFVSDTGGDGRAVADMVIRNPLHIRMNDMLFRTGSFASRAEVLFDKSGFRGWSALVNLDRGSLLLSKPAVRIEGITLSLPTSAGTGTTEEGSFAVETVACGGIERQGPAGRLSFHDKRARIEGIWQLLEASSLSFEANLAFENGVPRGKTRLVQDWSPLPGHDELIRLAPGLGDVRISGETRAVAAVTFAGPVITPRVEISLRKGAVSSREKDLDVTGIAGKVVINSLHPLATPGNQVITAERFRSGKFEAQKGRLAFRLEDRDRLFLEMMQWHLPEDGMFTLRGTRFDLTEKSTRLDLYLENVDFVALLSRMTDGKIDGSGCVNGRIPVSYESGRVMLDNGYIHALPGTGRLGIRDEEWMDTLMHYINEAMAGHAYLEIVADRIEEALRDFIYDYLTVDLKRINGETSARIELRGKGARGDPPQEIGSLVFNINDLEEVVNRALGFVMTSGESIDRTLEDLLDFQ
ncbi:MAG: hypothetical protein AVO39_07500 [delta proteobacterium MLS_D]|jgi:hypothetical protein|nr:MAG: hypothetical protein AVO39_07500 [delta proteobacterium MLS_D]